VRARRDHGGQLCRPTGCEVHHTPRVPQRSNSPRLGKAGSSQHRELLSSQLPAGVRPRPTIRHPPAAKPRASTPPVVARPTKPLRPVPVTAAHARHVLPASHER
jgi:hypothetical protein